MAYREHTVKQGDCISSIAYKYGFSPDTIWNDSKNSKLKQERKNPGVLEEGDVVSIPDKRLKEVEVPSGQRHRFRRKGVPEKLRLQLLENGLARAGVGYRLTIEEQLITGQTDQDGWFEHWIPPNARAGILLVDGDKEEMHLLLGSLPPVESNAGLDARLMNLGFLPEEREVDQETRAEGISAFQAQYGLKVTGEADDETRGKLVEIHGS